MKLALLALLLLFASAGSIPEETRRAIETGQYSAAILQLEQTRQTDRAKFEAADHDYLLARLAEKDGRIALAISSFSNVIERHSSLAPYALYHMSRIAASTGNLPLERIYLTRLRLEYPASLLGAGAVDRLARNALALGSPQAAISILTADPEGPAKSPSRSAQRERAALLGKAYGDAGLTERARALFLSLLSSTADPSLPDDAALTAVRGLDAFDGGRNDRSVPPRLSETDHMQRAGVYQFFRDFAAARDHYTAVSEGYRSGQNAPLAMVQIGRGFVQSGDYREALKWFDRVLTEYGDSASAKDALLAAASADSRLAASQEAIKRYTEYVDRYPTDDRLDRAYFNIVDVLRDAGDDNAALDWCAKATTVFRGKPAEAVAIFTAARIHIARDEWQDALDRLQQLTRFSDLGGATIPGGTDRGEVSRLRAFVLERLGRPVPGTADGPSAPRAISTKYSPPNISTELTRWHPDPTAQRLVDLQLYDDAIIQISADPSVPPYDLAKYAAFGDQAYRTLGFIEPLWRTAPKDFPIEQIPRQQAEMLYPVAYRDELLSATRPRSVDPRLLLAIIRQESRFQPDANSNAAARGLMQFISTTSNKIAAELGGPIDQDDLYDPETSILFGAQYAADLFRQFPDQPEAVVASYNAGEDNVARWIARSRSNLPERYVPEIMFTQTKDYVHKVMANYRAYCYLYDADLQPAH